MDDVAVVTLLGRVTLGDGAGSLRDRLHELMAAGYKKVLLNLAGITHMDSSGLGVLIAGFASMTNHGGQLKLLHLTKRLENLLVLTKLLTVFEAFVDEEKAIASFAAPAPAHRMAPVHAGRGHENVHSHEAKKPAKKSVPSHEHAASIRRA
jgi:anti-sigma B factor antagonist